MKRIIITLAVALTTMVGVVAQTSYKRVGNTFSAASTGRASHTKDTLVTRYTYQTKDGKSYPIVVNRTSGACYVWRKSAKTGKMYRMYLKADIKTAINKEFNLKK